MTGQDAHKLRAALKVAYLLLATHCRRRDGDPLPQVFDERNGRSAMLDELTALYGSASAWQFRPDDVIQAATEWVQRKVWYPAPAEIMELADRIAQRREAADAATRALAEQDRRKALPSPPVTDDERARLREKVQRVYRKLRWPVPGWVNDGQD